MGQPVAWCIGALPDVLARVELGAFRRQGENGDVGGNDQSRRQVPSGLIDQEDGVGMARSSRLSVCLAIVIRNSSNIHCARSISRQRTTLWIAGIGPFSIIRAIDWRWASLSLEGCPGALPLSSPSGPRALKRNTQSRIIRSPTPPIFAASVRVPPS